MRVYVDAERIHRKRYGWAFSKRGMFLQSGQRLESIELQQKISDRVGAVCEYLGLDLLID